MHPAVSLASLQGCRLQPDLWAPTTALSPVPSGAAGASPSMNLRKTPSPQTPPAPGCPRPTLRPAPQAWICCCPGCGPVLGVGLVGKREMKAQWEVGSPRRPSQCRTQSHKVARRAAGAGLVLVLEPQGTPGKSTGPPAHLQAGPRTCGETVGAAPSNHPPPLPSASRLPLWGRAPPEQQVKACGVAVLPGGGQGYIPLLFPQFTGGGTWAEVQKCDAALWPCCLRGSVCSQGHSDPSIRRVFPEIRTAGDTSAEVAGAWTRVHRPGDSRRGPQKGLRGAGRKLRPEEGPKPGHHSRDPQWWRRRPRLRVTSPVLGTLSGLCSPAASRAQDPVQGCCAGGHSRSLTLIATRVPGLGCRKRKRELWAVPAPPGLTTSPGPPGSSRFTLSGRPVPDRLFWKAGAQDGVAEAL